MHEWDRDRDRDRNRRAVSADDVPCLASRLWPSLSFLLDQLHVHWAL